MHSKKPVEKPYTRPENRALALRTCNADLTSHGGFQWPESGHVEAPDWNEKPACGGGLHGLLWGEGSGSYLSWEESAKWLLVEVDPALVVWIGGDKVKFPRGKVVFCGDRGAALEFLSANTDNPSRVCVGKTATAWYRGTATAGYRGTATAGHRGTATAGDSGTATAGDSGTATAGYSGIITIRWWDGKKERYRIAVGYVGEGGIEANTAYCVENGMLKKIEK